MTTDLHDLEARLRADLPRLAELIEVDTATELTPLPDKRRPRRALTAAIAACITVGAIVAGVAIRSNHHERVSTTPTVDTTPSTWRALPQSPLGQRGNPVVVWTGKEIIVWGGYQGDPKSPFALQSGAAYDPATNTWHKIADNQWAHPGAIGVWGGDRMYVLAKNGGAYYLPATNEWHDLPRLRDETTSGFVGAATDGRSLYGITYRGGDNQHPILEPFIYKPGASTWQVGAPLPAALQSVADATTNAVCPPGLHCAAVTGGISGRLPVVWNGTELIMSGGGRTVFAYDPANDSWRALPALPDPVSAASFTMSNGSLVAVYVNHFGLQAARLDPSGWTAIASDDRAHEGVEPLAVDAGGTLVVVDRAGLTAPLRIDPSTNRWVPFSGYPLALAVNGNAASTGDRLFVWAGLMPATPSPSQPDAAWYGK